MKLENVAIRELSSGYSAASVKSGSIVYVRRFPPKKQFQLNFLVVSNNYFSSMIYGNNCTFKIARFYGCDLA